MMYINNFGQFVTFDENKGPFIEHHGVRGQQWGVRNGDYYPLLPSQHSAAEKKAGWKKSLEGGTARRNKPSVGEMYRAAINSKAASSSGGSSSGSKTVGAYASMRDELIEKTKARLAGNATGTASSTSKGSGSKSSSGKSGGKSGGKGKSSKASEQGDEKNLEALKEDLKQIREELEGNTKNLISDGKSDQIASPEESKDKKKSSPSDDKGDEDIASPEETENNTKTTASDIKDDDQIASPEELVSDAVDIDKYTESIKELLKTNEPETVRKLIEEELSSDKSDSYKGLSDEVKEYLLKMVDKIIDENKSSKKSLSHYCINNYGCLVSYEEDYGFALYHHGVKGQEHGVRNGPPYPLARGAHSASERKAGWTSSLENIAKATGKGVARVTKATGKGVVKAAKATGKGVAATGRGIATAAKATKKGLIRVNLYPKKAMSEEDIQARVERLKQEDLLKHAMGKLSNEDKVNLKLKNKDAKREIVKETLKQLLPAIGKDLVISQIKNKLDYKLDIKKKEDAEDREWDKKVAEDLYKDARDAGMSAWEASEVARKLGTAGKGKNAEEIRPQPKKSEEEKNRDKTVWNDIYEDARAAGKSAAEARKAADEGDASIAPRPKDNNQNGGKGKGKGGNQFDLDNEMEKDIYNMGKKAGLTPTQAADMARRRDDSALRKPGTETDNVKDTQESTSMTSGSSSDTKSVGDKLYGMTSRISNLNKRAQEATSQKGTSEKIANLNTASKSIKAGDTPEGSGKTGSLNSLISNIKKQESASDRKKKQDELAQTKIKDAKASEAKAKKKIKQKGISSDPWSKYVWTGKK